MVARVARVAWVARVAEVARVVEVARVARVARVLGLGLGLTLTQVTPLASLHPSHPTSLRVLGTLLLSPLHHTPRNRYNLSPHLISLISL